MKKINSNNSERFHPTQKPVELYKWILKEFAEEGQIILDTHLGSGSSRIASNFMNMNFVGFEVNEDYFLKQNKRYEEFVSQSRLW
jgi:site-specific DNA-methyltransferase (adenine-specific)